MKKTTQYDVTTPSALRKTFDRINDKAEALRERVGDLEMTIKKQATKINKLSKGSGKKIASIILALFMLCLFTVPADAEIPHRQKERFYNTTSFEGQTNLKGPTTLSGSSITVSTALTGTSVVTATNIVDNTGTINFPLGAAMVDGTGPILAGTAPNLTTLDNVAAILYDNSTEVTPVQWTFPVPDDYVSTMVFYASISSNAANAGTILDWALIQNRNDVGFGGVTAQTLVAATSTTLDASNEVLTLTPNAAGAALFVDGATISFEIFNASTDVGNIEIKGAWAEYLKKQ